MEKSIDREGPLRDKPGARAALVAALTAAASSCDDPDVVITNWGRAALGRLHRHGSRVGADIEPEATVP
jgi:hypothetical protein